MYYHVHLRNLQTYNFAKYLLDIYANLHQPPDTAWLGFYNSTHYPVTRREGCTILNAQIYTQGVIERGFQYYFSIRFNRIEPRDIIHGFGSGLKFKNKNKKEHTQIVEVLSIFEILK